MGTRGDAWFPGKALRLVLAVVAVLGVFAAPALAHGGGSFTTRFQAEWQVREILRDEYYWFVTDVRCGSSTWTSGIHFPCKFTRLGSRYVVCYHSLDYDYGEITRYERWSCAKWY